jgi:hypothetical protein
MDTAQINRDGSGTMRSVKCFNRWSFCGCGNEVEREDRGRVEMPRSLIRV